MPVGRISGDSINSTEVIMVDMIIWCCVFLVLGLWLGFMLCMILSYGSLRKWHSYGDTYTSGRISALHEIYDIILVQQKNTTGSEWSLLNEVLNLIASMLPED